MVSKSDWSAYTPGRATIFLPAIILAGLALAPAVAGEPETPPVQVPKDLTEASFEELMQIEVTSVSRKGQELSHAPAAIYVITQEDIRRSGLTSVPELLRLAPGVELARVNAHEWAISARGFNGRVANKLLVLIDGRSVYTPMYSGVYWDAQDPPVEDIDRIEVIRGPGATMWGANAVNGVINVRYGGTIGPNAYYRAYARSTWQGPSLLPDGRSANGWRPGAKIEYSLCGQNLLDNRHLEFCNLQEGAIQGFEVGRSVFGKITWRF